MNEDRMKLLYELFMRKKQSKNSTDISTISVIGGRKNGKKKRS